MPVAEKNTVFTYFKWTVMIAAYWFLAYKLFTFNRYQELALQLKNMPWAQLWWLSGVVALVPVNWFLESVKWKKLVSKVQIFSTKNSLKAVLVGISTGFFTPNRIGEFAGRIVFLDSDKRASGVTMSAVNSLTQNMILALCGIPACIMFFSLTGRVMTSDIVGYLNILILCIAAFTLLYFMLPSMSRRLMGSSAGKKIAAFTACLSTYSGMDLLRILGVSLLRYAIFCFQFFLMLRFFGVQLELWQALIAIPANYLLVTFTPSVAFSEAAVRSSSAMLIIGVFSEQIVGIALASVCIWFINFILPMMAGSLILVRQK